MNSFDKKLFDLILDLDSYEGSIKYYVSCLRADGVNYVDGIDIDMLEMYARDMKQDMRKLYDAYAQLAEVLIEYTNRHN